MSKLFFTIKNGKMEIDQTRYQELLQMEGKRFYIGVANETRSSAQNNSIHLYLEQVAIALDREGHSMQDVVKAIKKAEIRPTMEALKEIVWKPIQWILFKKKSTTKLITTEVDRVYETVNAFIGREFQIHIPFPSQEIKDYEQYIKNTKAIQDF
jgi:hypothetical protein